MSMLLVMITTTALINTILPLTSTIQIQLKYTIVSEVTSHAKDHERKKEAKE